MDPQTVFTSVEVLRGIRALKDRSGIKCFSSCADLHYSTIHQPTSSAESPKMLSLLQLPPGKFTAGSETNVALTKDNTK